MIGRQGEAPRDNFIRVAQRETVAFATSGFPATPLTQWRSRKSPRKVSLKREYSAEALETFEKFSPRLPIFGAWRPIENTRNPREMQGFGALVDHNPRSSHCVAGDAVLIAPVSSQIPCKQGIFQGILEFRPQPPCPQASKKPLRHIDFLQNSL